MAICQVNNMFISTKINGTDRLELGSTVVGTARRIYRKSIPVHGDICLSLARVEPKLQLAIEYHLEIGLFLQSLHQAYSL